jgi:hypothetical protein
MLLTFKILQDRRRDFGEDIPVFEEGELEEGEQVSSMDIVFLEEARPASAPPLTARADTAMPGPSGVGKKRKLHTPDEASALLSTATEALSSLSSQAAKVEDTEATFGKLIANKLRDIQDKKKKNQIMFGIMKVFNDHDE